MVGILILAHDTLGESLVRCASHVMGSRPFRLKHLNVGVRDDPQALLQRGIKLLKQLDDGSGVLILSDMCGGTPCNIASRLLVPGKVEGVAGVSLPMVLRALTYRNEPLPMVAAKAMSGGCEGVMRLPVESCGHAAAAG